MDLQPSYNNQNDNFTHRERHAHKHDILERLIWISGGFLLSMLSVRFVFALLGANPLNGFAAFVYSFTTPFTTPFYNLFSYDHPSVGISTFEGYTLVAMGIYGLATAGLARLVTVTRYS
jgi:hypothetical protein